MSLVRFRIFAVLAVAASTGCYSGDGPDGGGGCADCTFETGDYEYSAWNVVDDGCGFDFTNPDGNWIWIDVSGDDFTLDDFLDGTVTNGHAEGAYQADIDLSDDGYDCVLDYTVALDGALTADGVLEVGSYTYTIEVQNGTECDAAVQDLYGFSGTPCETEATFTWARTFAMESNFETQDISYSAGLALAPQVRAMAHLHF